MTDAVYVVLYRQTAQCVQTEGTMVSWRLLWYGKVEKILSLISQLSSALVLWQNTNGCVIYDFCLSLFSQQSIPSVSDIYSMLHTSRPDNTSSALLQLHTAPNCQYKVFHPHLLFSQRRTYQLSATNFVFCLYRCLFGLRFPKCLGRCAYIVVFNLACC